MFTARYGLGIYIPPGLILTILRSAHTVYLCVFYESRNKIAIISLYSINWLFFITEIVYDVRLSGILRSITW